ncbi:glycosyltransferase family 31 protein [Xylariaceae sp. FL1272]|nr:glycosyltransferase family 31 protein [Xylariaceae sp. FL1272]
MWLDSRKRLRSMSNRLSRLQKIALSLVVATFFIYIVSPYDSAFRAFFRFQGTVVVDYYQSHYPSSGSWLYRRQRYPVDLDNEVGVIIKTGYGTKHRIGTSLKALSNETFFPDILVVQDFPVLPEQGKYQLTNGKKVHTVDIIGWNLERGALKGREHLERIAKYTNLADAVEAEEWALSEGLGRHIGWELDAMKFLPALEYAWNTMPKKKWYLMLDDDTYVIKGSLHLLLGQINYGKPHYIGNPVGDYKGRFSHGGSSVILSGATLRNLFEWHPEVAAEGNLESPSSIWGDKLLSTTLQKIGIYLDESYRRLFNGEAPWVTRMWMDRLCLPLIGFHGLNNPDAMEQVGETFKKIDGPIFWKTLAQIYNAPDYASFLDQPVRENINFVGREEEGVSVAVGNITKKEECVELCNRNTRQCMAWTYDNRIQRCVYAPWAILGDFAEGLVSGINAREAQRAVAHCYRPR